MPGTAAVVVSCATGRKVVTDAQGHERWASHARDVRPALASVAVI